MTPFDAAADPATIPTATEEPAPPRGSGTSATYSPDDNKLRLYAARRLSADVYVQVKAAGFRWAPKQDLFYATWSPGAEDMAEELAGEIDDEDKSLVARAEDRADRFEGYSDRRAADAEGARKAVAAIADHIPLGQPILAGHHSEKHARRDAAKIEAGMRKAVRMWQTSQYWTARGRRPRPRQIQRAAGRARPPHQDHRSRQAQAGAQPRQGREVPADLAGHRLEDQSGRLQAHPAWTGRGPRQLRSRALRHRGKPERELVGLGRAASGRRALRRVPELDGGTGARARACVSSPAHCPLRALDCPLRFAFELRARHAGRGRRHCRRSQRPRGRRRLPLLGQPARGMVLHSEAQQGQRDRARQLGQRRRKLHPHDAL